MKRMEADGPRDGVRGAICTCHCVGMYWNGREPTGGGGVPPTNPDFIAGENEIYKRNIDLGHFWYTNVWFPDPPLLSSNCTARDLGSAQPEIWAGSLLGGSHIGWRPRSFRRTAIRWGGAGGVRALYICIQLYIDELSPANPLIPSIALASRT